jgi:hypothetical protein
VLTLFKALQANAYKLQNALRYSCGFVAQFTRIPNPTT